MKPKRIAKTGSPAVKEWVSRLQLAKTRERLIKRLKDDEIYHFAGVVCCLPPEKRPQAYHTLHGFLLSSTIKLPRLPAALGFLPSDPEELWRIIEALLYFSRVTNTSLDSGKFKPDLIIRTMLQIPDHKIYIDHLFRRGFTSLGGMYHSNTLARAKTELRGLFGGSGEYLANPKDKLNIIDE